MNFISAVIDWLNENAGVANLLFSAVVAVATVFYALLTKALVNETRRMREAQTEPQITVRVESSETYINIVLIFIENIGNGPAYDLKLTSDPDFTGYNARPLSEFGPFKHGVKFMAPRQTIVTLLANLVGRGSELEDPNSAFNFTVRAQYRGALGQQYSHAFPIDFRHLIGSRTLGKPPMHSIAGSLEEIQKELARVGSRWKRLEVVAYSPEDIEREAREEEAELRARTSSSETPDD
jgi:hypothetical protein